MDPLEQFKTTYFQECEDLLGDLENQLMALQEGETEVDILHAAFRAIHSIKGGAGAFGFSRLVSFSHTFETVLDLMRDGKLELAEATVTTAVRASDIVADLVNAARSGEELNAGHETECLEALATLAGLDAPKSGGEDSGDIEGLDFTPVRVDDDPEPAESVEAPAAASATFAIAFKPFTEMYKRAHEPLLFIRELKALGTLHTTAVVDNLPDLEALEPEAAYLSWTFKLETTAEASTVEEIFEFVTDDCELTIACESEAAAPVVAEVAPVAPPADPEPEPQPAPTPAVAASPQPASVPKAPAKAPCEPVAAAPKAVEPAQRGKAQAGATAIRVDLDKVDRLVNMVGELVITQAMISQQTDDALSEGYPQLVQELEALYQHTRGLQDSVMAIRAQPVKSVFSRMPRLVRELSAQTEKKIRLVMNGEGTEIDKTVIEQLNDPLTHMIRNACDHGVETPEVREAAGKPVEGTINLSAEQRGGRIIIKITDDGAGVNRKRVTEKALEKGLITVDANLTDEEIDNLIFLPGFSTAETVSNISGRGVGMDVVKQNIQKLGGRVTIQSEPGKGSSMIMTLPLTLAVLDGMIVRVGQESYVLPLTNIIESLLPRAEDRCAMAGSGDVLRVRGEYVELVRLSQVFDIKAGSEPSSGELVVLTEVEGDAKVGLIVDEILGQQQVVIKSLEDNFDPIPGVAGATILGDGNVAMILDVGGLRSMKKKVAAGADSRPTNDVAKQEYAA